METICSRPLAWGTTSTQAEPGPGLVVGLGYYNQNQEVSGLLHRISSFEQIQELIRQAAKLLTRAARD